MSVAGFVCIAKSNVCLHRTTTAAVVHTFRATARVAEKGSDSLAIADATAIPLKINGREAGVWVTKAATAVQSATADFNPGCNS
eukprot:scaffold65808_cov48-Phaeocystis_antarctica.AAC.1